MTDKELLAAMQANIERLKLLLAKFTETLRRRDEQ